LLLQTTGFVSLKNSESNNHQPWLPKKDLKELVGIMKELANNWQFFGWSFDFFLQIFENCDCIPKQGV
jgi:hypothetical protein